MAKKNKEDSFDIGKEQVKNTETDAKSYMIKEIVEKVYFNCPEDVKKTFDADKIVGYEKIADGEVILSNGRKTAYCIKTVTKKV